MVDVDARGADSHRSGRDDGRRTVPALMITGSPGPRSTAPVLLQVRGGALPPLVIQDPSSEHPGLWRRMSETRDGFSYVRIPRIAAP